VFCTKVARCKCCQTCWTKNRCEIKARV